MRSFFEALATVWLCIVGASAILSAIAIIISVALQGRGAFALVLVSSVTIVSGLLFKSKE